LDAVVSGKLQNLDMSEKNLIAEMKVCGLSKRYYFIIFNLIFRLVAVKANPKSQKSGTVALLQRQKLRFDLKYNKNCQNNNCLIL